MHLTYKYKLQLTKEQEKFKCINCGFEENADYNAAKNILRRGTPLARQRETLVCA